MLTKLGVCIGYLAQAAAWARRLTEGDLSDEEYYTAVECLNRHIPLVREKLIEISEEEHQRILERRDV